MVNKEKKEISIPVNGNLGILAYGDIGLRAWRKVRDEAKAKEKKENNEKNEKNNKEHE